MTLLYGRAARGGRAVASVPQCHWRTTTTPCAVRLGGPLAAEKLDGATGGDTFLAYVSQVLAPGLRARDVVAMDNLVVQRARDSGSDPSRGGAIALPAAV